MERFARRIPLVLASGLLFVALSPAPARSLALAPDPLLWDLSGQGAITSWLGVVDVIAIVNGLPAGGVVDEGTVAPTDITIVFEATNDAASDAVLIIPQFHLAGTAIASNTAAGSIPGPGVDVRGAIGSAFFETDPFAPGTTSDLFFFSFSSLTPGETIDFQIVAIPIGTFTVVAAPEPGAAGLALAALVGAALRVRRRRAGG